MHLLSRYFSRSGQPSRVRPWQPDLGVAKKARGRAVHSEQGAGLLEKEEDFLIERSLQLGPQGLSQLLCKTEYCKKRRVCCFLAGQQDWAETESPLVALTAGLNSRDHPGPACPSFLGSLSPNGQLRKGTVLKKQGADPVTWALTQLTVPASPSKADV